MPSATSHRQHSHKSQQSAPPAIPPAREGRCNHLRADGKRCADACYPGHTFLCHHHLNRQMRGIADGNLVAADLLATVGNFQSANSINIALGKLLIHQITGRISRQDALAIAYTFQLILQTLPAVKAELDEMGYSKCWRDETKRVLCTAPDLADITDPQLLPSSSKPLRPKPIAPNPPPAPVNPPAQSQPSAPVQPPLQVTQPAPAPAVALSNPGASQPLPPPPPGSPSGPHALGHNTAP